MRRCVPIASLILGAASLLATGCFSLSFGGGGACHSRLECLERRVEALERQCGTATPTAAPTFAAPPSPVPVPSSP